MIAVEQTPVLLGRCRFSKATSKANSKATASILSTSSRSTAAPDSNDEVLSLGASVSSSLCSDAGFGSDSGEEVDMQELARRTREAVMARRGRVASRPQAGFAMIGVEQMPVLLGHCRFSKANSKATGNILSTSSRSTAAPASEDEVLSLGASVSSSLRSDAGFGSDSGEEVDMQELARRTREAVMARRRRVASRG